MEENQNNNQSGENNQQGQNDQNKVKVNFEKAIKKLADIVGGEENVFPAKKVEQGILGKVVNGLLKERKEKAEVEIKQELITLLDKRVALEKEFKAKEDEFNKLKDNNTYKGCGRMYGIPC